MTDTEANKLDIVIPVYNEGENIVNVMNCLGESVKTPCRVLICYDFEEDTTIAALRGYDNPHGLKIVYVKNQGRGAHAAVCTGFDTSTAPIVLVYPGDDVTNAGIIDEMVRQAEEGCDVVVASRFVKEGCMVGCPLIKSILVRTASFTLYWFAFIPVRDASNGFRMFSGRLLDTVRIESKHGFTYALELLVKCHRLRWRIGEVPAKWFERTTGASRFKVRQWLPRYLRWYLYGFATTWLRRKPASVVRKQGPHAAASLT